MLGLGAISGATAGDPNVTTPRAVEMPAKSNALGMTFLGLFYDYSDDETKAPTLMEYYGINEDGMAVFLDTESPLYSGAQYHFRHVSAVADTYKGKAVTTYVAYTMDEFEKKYPAIRVV